MQGKKKFIDKKTAQHFHVVHRSQRDPKANDPDASKYVLLSSKVCANCLLLSAAFQCFHSLASLLITRDANHSTPS